MEKREIYYNIIVFSSMRIYFMLAVSRDFTRGIQETNVYSFFSNIRVAYVTLCINQPVKVPNTNCLAVRIDHQISQDYPEQVIHSLG